MRDDNIDFTCDTEDCLYWQDGVCQHPASITIQEHCCVTYEKAPDVETVISFAEKRLDEEAREPNGGDCRYWAAYLDGARAQAKEDAKKEENHD